MARAKTVKIRYVGEHGPQSVPRQGDTDLEFLPGKTVEVDAEFARGLLIQDTYEEVKGGS